MASSISSSDRARSTLPLVADLRAQAGQCRRFLTRALLLLGVFLCLDRLLGWGLRMGLERYYGLNAPAAVLCVGHSHTVLGIDKLLLEQRLGVPIAKFSVEGANTADRLMMLRYFFARHPQGIRAVVYDVDAHSFSDSGLSSRSYQLLFPFIDDPDIRAYLRQNSSATQYLLCRWLCTPRYNEFLLSLAARGYLKKWTNLKTGSVDYARLTREIRQGRFRPIEFNRENLELFDQTANFVARHGATLFLAYIPTIDALNQAEPEKFQRSLDILRHYAMSNPKVVFLNYNQEFQSRHDLFWDGVHLNRNGQQQVTGKLAEDLKRFLGPNRWVNIQSADGRSH